MIIEIDDNLPGAERHRMIIVKQSIYAMEKFKRKTEAAKFLGISDRTFRDWCHRYEELSIFIHYDRVVRHKTQEDRDKYFEMLKRYPDG